jgi:hypothetical protein
MSEFKVSHDTETWDILVQVNEALFDHKLRLVILDRPDDGCVHVEIRETDSDGIQSLFGE